MKNNLFISIFLIFFNFFILKANALEQFNFDVTEINIIENGRKFIGTNRGIIKSNDGVETVDFVKFNDAYNKALKSEESEIHAEELKFKEVNKKRYLRFNKLIKDLNANEYKEKAKTKLKKIKSTLFKFFKR